MRRTVIYLLTGVFLLALVAFTTTDTVRFTEAAVVTTFGRATESDVRRDAGLLFKLPYPIQAITKYDTRARVINSRLETIATADNRQVVVEAFAIWRVSDPLRFFQRFSNAGERADEHYRKAEGALRDNLRAAAGLVSQYRMDELFTADQTGSRLPQLEERMFAAFQSASDQTGLRLADYGIEAVDLGIVRVVLPEETTKAVFQRMSATRGMITTAIQSEGQAQAQAIKNRAEADANRIRAFAERRAQEIRTRGDLEAAPSLLAMNANPQLAVFLENMKFIEGLQSKGITLVLPSSTPGLSALNMDSLDGLTAGQIPTLTGGAAAPSGQAPTGSPAGAEGKANQASTNNGGGR